MRKYVREKPSHPCVDCGRMITHKATRCSFCAKKLQPLKKSDNPNWRGGKYVPCDNCGKLVWRTPSELLSRKDGSLCKNNFCSNKCRGVWQRSHGSYDKEAMKVKVSKTLKEKWENDQEFAKKVVRSWKLKPSLPEKQLTEMIAELGLPYKYVGDGEFLIGRKCPDFINIDGQKKAIELFGDYWHKGKNPQDRIDLFAQYGFDTLIIWQKELKNPEKVKEALLFFNSKGDGHGK